MNSLRGHRVVIVLTFFAFLGIFSPASAQHERSTMNTPSDLESKFNNPPDSVRPSVYWYWMSDNISKDGVVRDLEAMKKIGIGRAFIGNIGYPKEEVPYGNVKLFSEEWWDITKTAITTAAKHNIDIGLFNSPGWSQSGGPWIRPSQSMRYVMGEEWRINGGQVIQRKLNVSKENFQDIALLAFPEPLGDNDHLSLHGVQITSNIELGDPALITDRDPATQMIFPDGTRSIQLNIKLNEPVSVRSLVIYPANIPFKANIELQYLVSGNYKTIRSFPYDRSNPQNIVGFIPYAPISIALPPVKTADFRLIYSDISGKAGIADINLSSAPVVERYMEKQLAKMFQTPLPLWKEYQWPEQDEPRESAVVIDQKKVINISKYLRSDGTLNWNAPAGKWVIIRFGMVPTGVMNGPASAEGIGLELDKLNDIAMEHHFDSFVGKIRERIPAADRTALKWVVADSYETGSQNWTDGMALDFKKIYGYDPIPWLPVLTGRIVENASASNRFLWDLRRLVADRVSYKYVGGLRKVSNKHDMKLWLENYGHWGFPGEFLQYGGQADEVGGEFWNEGDLGSIENRAASSAAHIYGKTKVAAESFTAGGMAYARYPALLKKRGDWSFTEGVNNTLLHVFITQPYEDRSPGVNAGFGTEFNRKNTWFYQGKAFVDYIRRCNYMLQRGLPVNDVAYFIGEDAPKMTGIKDPELDPGYQFDYINAEVILNRLTVKDSRFVLPDGMSYALLVLPKIETMRPELLRRIKQLVSEGGIILGPAPRRSPSLQGYPAADEEVRQLAAEIWGRIDGNSIRSSSFGKGRIYDGMTMKEVMKEINVLPDFQTDQPVLYTHRRTNDTDIYFITNQSDKLLSFPAEFRVSGRQPELWNPVTGKSRILPEFTEGETTRIPLKLEAYESAFIVFKRPVTNKKQESANFPRQETVLNITQPWQVRFDTAQRGPKQPIEFSKLMDWSKHPNENIKNYSGTAFYTTSFSINKNSGNDRYLIDLGTVKVMATVKLNGKEIGTVWTAPWQLDITDALNRGTNKLEIEVVNTWINRLIGDSRLPEDQRRTWTNVNPFKPDTPYDTSGLIGPVVIKSIKY